MWVQAHPKAILLFLVVKYLIMRNGIYIFLSRECKWVIWIRNPCLDCANYLLNIKHLMPTRIYVFNVAKLNLLLPVPNEFTERGQSQNRSKSDTWWESNHLSAWIGWYCVFRGQPFAILGGVYDFFFKKNILAHACW